jgi:hypothetical protein
MKSTQWAENKASFWCSAVAAAVRCFRNHWYFQAPAVPGTQGRVDTMSSSEQTGERVGQEEK